MSTRSFVHTVRQTIDTFRMFAPGNRVLVAVSGGPDSVALLAVLRKLSPVYGLHLEVAHLEHGLRGAASEHDAEFVAQLADRWQMTFHMRRVNVDVHARKNGLSLEEAGRVLRYDFFQALAREKRLDKIALGHHMDDNAELVLMNMLRGSGPLGLAGIPAVRGKRIVRPLMRVNKVQIQAFLAAQGIPWVADQTNLVQRHLRNRVRQRLLPLMKSAFNPAVVETLNRTAGIARDENSWIETQVEAIFADCRVADPQHRLALSAGKMCRQHVAVQRRLVRLAVRRVKNDLRRLTFRHVEAVLQLAQAKRSGAALCLPGGVRVERHGRRLVFLQRAGGRQQAASPQSPSFCHRIEAPGRFWIAELGIGICLTPVGREEVPDGYRAGQRVAFFDMDKAGFPLTLRNVISGDRFVPLGMRGTKKVRRFFIDRKVPAHLRERVPLLLDGGRVIWVVGWRLDERFRLDAGSRNICRVELLLA